MIIDYHLRGDQRRLEKEFPEIAKKAKHYLGYEVYFELSLTQVAGVPMDPSDPLHDVLMKK